MGRRMLITLQLGLLLLALLVPLQVHSNPTTAAPAAAPKPTPAAPAAPPAGSVRALQCTAGVLAVPLSSLLLHLYF